MEAIRAETVRCDFKMTSYYGKMLMTRYYIHIDQQVTHVSFIIYDRKHNENCNTFIHVLTLNAVVFFIGSYWTHHNEVSHLETVI
jgi:hypothetical protein